MGLGAVGPADCALLFGVPLTLEDFRADLQAGREKDYIAGSFGYPERPVASTLWEIYHDSAEFMSGVAADVKRLGVTVIRQARYEDVADVAKTHAVVTIVGHWRDGAVREWEIDDPRALAARLNVRGDDLASRLRGMLKGQTSGPLDDADLLDEDGWRKWRRAVARDISEKLPDVPLGDDLWFAATEGSQPPAADVRRDINGTFLRRHLGYLFRGTIGVELRDGIYSAADIAARLPARWRGTLDLTVCHSVLLGEVVKRAFPTSTIVANRQRASPELRLAIYRELIRILHDTPGPYDKTMLKLRDYLNRQ